MTMPTNLKALPMCGRCGTPVDRVTEEYDDIACLVRFSAYCHGAVERVTLDRETTHDAGGITMGVAFRQRRGLPAMEGG